MDQHTRDIRDIYEAEVNRGPDMVARTDPNTGRQVVYPPDVVELVGEDGKVLNGVAGRPRWPSDRERPSEKDAMADGFMAYCTQDDNPYTDDDLVRAWEKGFRTAEDFYEGEPCQEA